MAVTQSNIYEMVEPESTLFFHLEYRAMEG